MTAETTAEPAHANGQLSREQIRELSELSPFELERELAALAPDLRQGTSREHLDAGRGNPNWIAASPREAFFTLGHFAVGEGRRVWNGDDIGGSPAPDEAFDRFGRFCAANPGLPGVVLLRECVDYGIRELGFEPDPWVHELADAILGDHYPTPNRMLPHCEKVVHHYLHREVLGSRAPQGTYDLFAVEGGTAAMCYLFDSLVVNKILHPGDKVALMTPIFAPYVEIPKLDRYDFDVVHVSAESLTENGLHTWDYPDSELDKLADPGVKAVCMVNPSNPPSMELSDRARARLVDIVHSSNRDLVIVTDDVYATFVPGFTSLAAVLPRNTVLVYSYSKHYGCTGWRLGVIGLHESNVIDDAIARLPEDDRAELASRYGLLALHPERIKFIDRVVADSRQVALNHTAGLSLPQQVQMALFSLFDLQDEGQAYKRLLREVVHRRMDLLLEGADVGNRIDPKRAAYYLDIDVLGWARRAVSDEFAEYMRATYEPADVIFRLAQQHSVVLLSGRAFAGSPWSVRISMANLDDLVYLRIGHDLRSVFDEYVAEWRAASGASPR